MDRPQISVVIPLFNEEDNVQPLLDELFAELEKLGRTYEIICIDDGSRDGTFNELQHYAARRQELRVIRFRLNFGQTAAMSAGIESARGDVIVPMDGDLQNDPADIGKLLGQLDAGSDVVSGWRRDRKDREEPPQQDEEGIAGRMRESKRVRGRDVLTGVPHRR